MPLTRTALPIRRWASFLPGTGLGGSFVHWNGQSFRFQVADFIYKYPHRAALRQEDPRSGPDDPGLGRNLRRARAALRSLRVLSWESAARPATSRARSSRGVIPFEAPRAREYPTPPMKEPYFGALFRKGAENLGYHPYPQPSSNLSRPYTNPAGLALQHVRLLRILRALRLRALCQGQPADGDSAGAAQKSKL